MLPPPPCSTLFPYTTLFRSRRIGTLRRPDLRAVPRALVADRVARGAVERLVGIDHPVHGDALPEQLVQQAIRLQQPGVLVRQVHRDDQAAGRKRALGGPRVPEPEQESDDDDELLHGSSTTRRSDWRSASVRLVNTAEMQSRYAP